MNDLRIIFEWIDPAGAQGPELRATWARLQLLVNGESITRPLDNVSKTVRDSIFLPLYPLAEWLATHWWFLLNEIETPGRPAEDNYASRHDLQYASEGFAIPSTLIKPLGNTIKIDWTPAEFGLQRIEFVGQGTAYVSSSDFVRIFSGFISSVTQRLTDLDITGTLLQEEWKAILESPSEEREFCEAAAALGLDPYSIDEQAANEIVNVGNSLPKSLIGDFFSVADFARLGEQVSSVVQALELSRSNTANLKPLKDLREATQARIKIAGAPWEQGYQVARQLRQELGLNGKVLHSLEDVSRALRLNSDELNEAIRPRTDQSNTFDAVVGVNNAGSPGFVITHLRKETFKFAFCRGLFEFLFADQQEPVLVTKTRSERQKRNRAFASEFLLPADALRQRISTEYVSEEVIEDFAAEFGVSTYVVEHQLQNHRIARTIPA
jgi:IrrE N-terminal-like domain